MVKGVCACASSVVQDGSRTSAHQHVDLFEHVAIECVQPAPGAERVVQDQRAHLIAASNEGLDQM